MIFIGAIQLGLSFRNWVVVVVAAAAAAAAAVVIDVALLTSRSYLIGFRLIFHSIAGCCFFFFYPCDDCLFELSFSIFNLLSF